MVDTTCNPLSKSLSAGNESTETGAIFDYCTADDSDFTQMEPICYSCMKNMDGNIYISNCQ